jgi:DNA-directed RNA polymerase subunit M/transcription elongation factor TFIIS
MDDTSSTGSTKKKPVIKTKASARDLYREKMHQALDNYLPAALLDDLERLVYENNSDDMAQRKMSILFHHLDPTSTVGNTYLTPKLASGELTVSAIAAFKSENDLNPNQGRYARRSMIEAQQIAHGVQRALSDLIKCRKCGGNTEYIEKQTRSCDEAMTVIAHCPKCKIKFTV